MTFTYGGNPANSTLEEVRFLLNDTTSPGELSDEEITYLLAQHGTALLAALAGARVLYAKFAREVTRAVGDLRIAYSDKAKAWADVITELETLVASGAPAEVYAAGQSLAEERADELDLDLPQPHFEVGMHDLDDAAQNEDEARKWGLI